MKSEIFPTPANQAENLAEQELNQEFITTESFAEQFNQEYLLEGNDPVPYAKVEPENPVSEDWVVYVGGFGQGKESYLDEIQSLAHSGMKVLFTNPTRGIEGENKLSTLQDVPDTIHNKSRAVQEILNKEGITSASFVGHSQGGAVISTFVAEHPGLAKNIILLNSAGTKGGDDSRERIMGRFAADKAGGVAHDVLTFSKNFANSVGNKFQNEDEKVTSKDEVTVVGKSGRRAGKSFGKEVFGNYKDISFRLAQEIPGVAAVDIAPMLKAIKERGETNITIVNANKDKVYSPEAFAKMFGAEELLSKIEKEEKAFKESVAAGEKQEGDQVYSKELREELDDETGGFQNEYADAWANYSREAATHSEPIAGKAGLLVSILNPEQNIKEINKKLDQEQAAA